ncbi:hypothetical protein AL755_17165 [Arthrobacter sp. ERGS1:01]|uniref:hypothetical protein n=1 Tax=Arthrobacter sp. ERGS1:01 TaxID=1704044 RepID=UPI0006B40112|nr:hypothetical protein [Arthrobacter sp. ERGS1:01]ALE06783.1 hypothetical protein AL755_17165 [Arthrobacter sp. ERGS1:01]
MENESMRDAREALAAVGSARSAAADRLVTPWWYHPVLGLLVAGFVLVYALGNLVVIVAGIVVYFVGLGMLMAAYKNKTGIWVSGFRAGAATPLALVLVGLYLACMIIAILLARLASLDWVAWVAAPVLFIATVVVGRRFDAALRAQLREQP